MKKIYYALSGMLLILLLGLSASAATFSFSAKLRDKSSGFDIIDADYRVLQLPDSTVVANGITCTKYYNGTVGGNMEEVIQPRFLIHGLDTDKKYVLEITSDRYEPLYIEIDPSKLGKRESELNVGYLEMKRAHSLEEFTVIATKVKFYNKGDTLIYNADAFRLAEGSMLDALIAQLPGAELKYNGEIFVNGRKVESLLLNNKDFFKGNNKIMLDNLGAYTVKNIAVYDGQKEEDKIMGKNYGEKVLTMDVRLKKEYNRGFIMNAEAGYGIEDKFLGRLFGLWFDDRARVGFYGNANNNSNTWNPNQNGTSSMPATTVQEITTYGGGVDYNVSIPKTPMSFSGNGNATYTKTKGDTRTYTTNFLTGGDTYGYSFDNGRLTRLELYTEHSVKGTADNWNWHITPKFRYIRNTEESRLISATFNREWDDIDRGYIEGIYSGNSSQVLSSMINRNIRDFDSHGNNAWFNIWSSGKRKVNATDALSYLLAYTYDRKHDTSDELIRLNYDDNPTPVLDDKRHYDINPNFNWRAKGNIGYIRPITKELTMELAYTYQRYFSRTVSDLYRTQEYIESQTDNLVNFAPSALNSYGTLDRGNSFDSRYKEETHDINFNFNFNFKWLVLRLELPLSVRRQWLHYMRGDMDAHLDRTKVFPGNFQGNVNINTNGEKRIWIYIGYHRKVTSPDMVDMVDFTNSLDPLNVRKGNPDLKDASSDRINASMSQTLNKQRDMKHTYGFDTEFFRNSLAYGYRYDRNTGVKTGMMYNVMGNAAYSVFQNFSTGFARLNCMNVDNWTVFKYRRSTDMLSADDAAPSKNIVNSYGLEERISLSYSHSVFKLTGQANVGWKRYTSMQEDFIPFNAWDMRYALYASVNLSANFSLNTDFNIYARRGYTEPSLNKNNYVWNARLTYKMMKGNLLLMLDGFDILHNLSNINYTVNAQARTETYTGVVPRYFMFHIQWKFNKQSKKR